MRGESLAARDCGLEARKLLTFVGLALYAVRIHVSRVCAGSVATAFMGRGAARLSSVELDRVLRN